MEDPCPDPVSLINEPLPPDNVSTLVPRQRSIHALLVESLNSTRGLLTRLELGVDDKYQKINIRPLHRERRYRR
jgi:hypothetical protein